MALASWLLGAAPALAIVGPSTDGAALSSHVVMVLNRLGRMAGYCSGLVLAPTFVLTAAHCVPEGAALKVHFRDEAGAPVLLDTEDVVRHPGYRADAIRTRERSIDLALIHLPARLPARFEATAIDAATPELGATFRLAGFGLTREGVATSSGQLRVALAVARQPLSPVLLWAQDRQGRGTGACTGDSGGPVFDARSDHALALMVWSSGAGALRCGVLTQAIWLGPHRSWIEATMRAWGTAP